MIAALLTALFPAVQLSFSEWHLWSLPRYIVRYLQIEIFTVAVNQAVDTCTCAPGLYMSGPQWTFFMCRSDNWWNYIVMRTFRPHDWLENFRMSSETFTYLCDQLRPKVMCRNTRFRQAVSVEQRVAIAIWCLATPSEYRTIGHLFGVARCTVCIIVKEVCQAIVEVLLPKYICFPIAEQVQKTIDGFGQIWGVPQCVGVIDGSHIPILSPVDCHTDYYNHKGWYSIILQGIVDHKYCFAHINVGWPGSVHDARVYINSSVYKKAIDGTLFPESTTNIGGHDVPLYLIGDSAYPLQSWLMKPFSENSQLTVQQKNYNYRKSRARIIVENAYGRLKARWRRLMKKNEMHVSNVPTVISACCVLHNVCEIHGEEFKSTWLEEITRSTSVQPASVEAHDDTAERPNVIRNALVEYFTAS